MNLSRVTGEGRKNTSIKYLPLTFFPDRTREGRRNPLPSFPNLPNHRLSQPSISTFLTPSPKRSCPEKGGKKWGRVSGERAFNWKKNTTALEEGEGWWLLYSLSSGVALSSLLSSSYSDAPPLHHLSSLWQRERGRGWKVRRRRTREKETLLLKVIPLGRVVCMKGE